MATVFLSYARRSSEVVKTLVDDLEALGYAVWFDQDMSGGHAWWTQILSKVRECDVFAFVLDPDSLDSTACQREYGYAAELNKRILPILVSGDVSMNLLPSALSQIQFVDYRVQDRAAVLRLAKALTSLPPPTPPPDPMPALPAAPISYLGTLVSQVESASPLTYEQQSALLVDLRKHLRDPETAVDARRLLERLRKRRDLFATIAEDMNDVLAAVTKEPARSLDQNQMHHVAGAVVMVASPASVESPLPNAVPAAIVVRRPGRRERLLSALAGMMVATIVGMVALTTVHNVPAMLGVFTGVGGAIAGAITGRRLRIAAVALLGAVLGWFFVAYNLSNSQDALVLGTIFGAPIGGVLGAVLGVLLRKTVLLGSRS